MEANQLRQPERIGAIEERRDENRFPIRTDALDGKKPVHA